MFMDRPEKQHSCRLSYMELCQMIQLLRPELHSPQTAKVAQDFMVFAFESSGRTSIGSPEDEVLEFKDFCAVAHMIPGVGHVLSIDASSPFDAEKSRIMGNLAKYEDTLAEKNSANKIEMQDT